MLSINVVLIFIQLLSNLLEVTILTEVILSYIPRVKEKSVAIIIRSFNFPILEPFRRLQQNIFGMNMVDFSPIFAIIVIRIVRKFIEMQVL